MPIRTVVWGENIHERTNAVVGKLYPKGMHEAIADLLRQDAGLDVSTATMEQPEHGLPQSRLEATDVLLWWGHKDHGGVSDDVVERVAKRVWEGMGLIVLHSAHFSKIFRRLMGSPCALKWREAGERERLWVTAPGHPIARGLPQYFELENEEMYGEHFSVPEPLETVFISWFQGEWGEDWWAEMKLSLWLGCGAAAPTSSAVSPSAARQFCRAWRWKSSASAYLP